MTVATAIFPNTVYQDINRHTTIVCGVSGTRKIVVEHVPMGGSLDLVRTPLDTFVEQFPTLMDYPASKAAATYIGGGYIPCSATAHEFLTNLSKGIEMPIKTVGDTPADTTTEATTSPAPAPAPVAAKKAPAAKKAAPVPAAKKAAKVAPPAPAPAAKKAAAKKVAAEKAPRVSAADKKAAQEALDGKQVIQLAKGGLEKCITTAMKEMGAFLEKKPEGVSRAKLFEKFSKDRHAGVTKMNINWGIKQGAFKIAK